MELLIETGTVKKIRKPKPWKHPQPITKTQLMQMRDEFWDTAPHYGGRKGSIASKCMVTKDLFWKLLQLSKVSLPNNINIRKTKVEISCSINKQLFHVLLIYCKLYKRDINERKKLPNPAYSINETCCHYRCKIPFGESYGKNPKKPLPCLWDIIFFPFWPLRWHYRLQYQDKHYILELNRLLLGCVLLIHVEN